MAKFNKCFIIHNHKLSCIQNEVGFKCGLYFVSLSGKVLVRGRILLP